MLPCNFKVFSLGNTLFRVFCFILFHFYTLFHDTSVLPQVMLCAAHYLTRHHAGSGRIGLIILFLKPELQLFVSAD